MTSAVDRTAIARFAAACPTKFTRALGSHRERASRIRQDNPCPLARSLDLPLFSKDAVKETLLDHLGYADRAESRRIGAASGEVLWTLLGECPGPGIVESWFAPSIRGVVRDGLRRAAVGTVVEVWCACPPQVAASRYASCHRHPGHFDVAMLGDLEEVLATAEPLGLGEVITVSTDRVVDIEQVADLVRKAVHA